MTRSLISSGSTFEKDIGYSRAVVQGDWIFVSGTTGFDYTTMTLADGVVAQCEQCFRNIEAALSQAGATLADVVRVHYILPQADEFAECWPVLQWRAKRLRTSRVGSQLSSSCEGNST